MTMTNVTLICHRRTPIDLRMCSSERLNYGTIGRCIAEDMLFTLIAVNNPTKGKYILVHLL
jgi:hypothetical protein